MVPTFADPKVGEPCPHPRNSVLLRHDRSVPNGRAREGIRTATATAVLIRPNQAYMADLGSGCGQLKSGAPARGERVAKYNRLLEITAKDPSLPYGPTGTYLNDPNEPTPCIRSAHE
ncbi:Enolase, C-terminal TIM barrel domain [Arthrobacter sp. ok909]|nr:Enolase, C-terminal TIM barrel domain [Arthrobacter sp. ok909]